jgi:hypothetical protein
MALTAAVVLTRVSDIVQDQTNVRWPETELLRYLNDARREISIVRPDLYAITANVTLSTGTKQALPAGGTRLLDVTRTMNSDIAGRAIRVVEKEILDAQRPLWHTEQTTNETKHFMLDERNPRVFYVYPPAASGTKVELTYSQAPTEITSTATELTEEDIYTGAIVDYICYRAFSKDAEYAANPERAQMHYRQFQAALGVGQQQDVLFSPNTANVGGMVPRAAAVARS